MTRGARRAAGPVAGTGALVRGVAAALAIAAAMPAHAAWVEARTDHFLVYSDDAPDKVKAQAVGLERFDRALRKLRGLREFASDKANPLTVYVVPNVGAVQKLCGILEGSRRACSNTAGFYEGRAEGSVAFMPRHAGTGGKLDLNAQIVLFHEYSHHIMLANYSAAYPAWFVEGYAEFNSTASLDADGSIGFGRPALHRAYGLILTQQLKLPELLTADPVRLPPEKRESLYGRGWLLTHYLTFEPTRKGQLGTYLKAVNEGKGSLEAAKAAFGDLAALDRELDAYIRRRAFTYFVVKPDALPDSAVGVRMLTPGEAAMMPVRLRSDRGVDEAAAAAVVADARRLAAPFPNDAGAQAMLAEAEYDAGHDAEAEAAADRALAADPKNRAAMMYKGRVLVRRARQADADAAAWRTARGWFVRANRAEPDDAAPLYLFYRSFLSEGVTPPANAVLGLVRAFELAPQDGGLRFMLARQYLIDKRYKDARETLAPLAFDPHAPADSPAATLLALIDRNDAPGIAAIVGQSADPDR
ncbi:hypothetical protein [Sphingomonas profundi]|uniref:hypothetical protein n=1 Tax=Alterirhizorhabdus profundi TaxID=2681549 RepID=UPI0012E99088|nr:hypothetical protein [Sphingomonas profundi]